MKPEEKDIPSRSGYSHTKTKGDNSKRDIENDAGEVLSNPKVVSKKDDAPSQNWKCLYFFILFPLLLPIYLIVQMIGVPFYLLITVLKEDHCKSLLTPVACLLFPFIIIACIIDAITFQLFSNIGSFCEDEKSRFQIFIVTNIIHDIVMALLFPKGRH